MSTTVNNEDLELEEGEIAEDSNDGCSINNDSNDNANDFDDDTGGGGVGVGFRGGLNSTSGLDACDAAELGAPQKKRKKVVRKVRRKIKVKKKVLKKKGTGNQNPSEDQQSQAQQQQSRPMQQQQQQQPLLLPQTNQQPLLPHIHNQLLHQNQNQLPSSLQQTQLPSQTQIQPQPSTLLNQQLPNQSSNQPSPFQSTNQAAPGNQLDNLWEQQILMLQELQRQQQLDQQHAQILRAASTDEDLRIFPPINMVNLNSQTQSVNSNALQQQLQPLDSSTIVTCASSSGPLAIANNSVNSSVTLNTNTMTTSSTTPLLMANLNNNHQTPSSPDDENGKSSYEAISKMLTMLRNSANLSDSSEMNETEQTDSSHTLKAESNLADYTELSKGDNLNVEYSLVPILVEGIDYTKYKLLSQYEPKFKNDPRLNQQT